VLSLLYNFFEIANKQQQFQKSITKTYNKQIKNLKQTYLALDDLKQGIGNKIPLWLFGFLY
jgi:hypothetical protein